MTFQTLRFQAMGCPCEILLDSQDAALGAAQLDAAVREAARIEQKYSRYLSGNIVDQINNARGQRIAVDEETAALLDYAARCYELSAGLFDITTGGLRKVWRFDGGVAVAPEDRPLAEARAHTGWDRISWENPWLKLPAGFEIDLGGICKEYAADRILTLLRARHPIATLVNLGGDIAAAGDRLWSVGIEDPSRPGAMKRVVHLREGAIATSGVSKRFVTLNGKSLGHILNPKTGWPVQDAPQSVTVAAKTCTEAGFWSTLGMLRGLEAESFLKAQLLEFWCFRSS